MRVLKPVDKVVKNVVKLNCGSLGAFNACSITSGSRTGSIFDRS